MLFHMLFIFYNVTHVKSEKNDINIQLDESEKNFLNNLGI